VRLHHQALTMPLEKLRNCFVFACFTGLAYNELEQLEESDILTGVDGFKWIRTKRVKTGSPEDVPLLPIAEAIIERFRSDGDCVLKEKLLPVISNQKFNKNLKDIAEICGISKAITSHTARHTFATTICLDNGITIETLSRMLGHSSIRVTQIYGKITTVKISAEMKKLKKKLFYNTGGLKAVKLAHEHTKANCFKSPAV